MKSINEMWLSYMDEVIPAGAPPIQIQESKRAFYGGVKGALSVLNNIAEDTVSEDEGVALLETMHVELEAFKDAVVAGQE